MKAILIAMTALALLVPLGLIAGITGERDARRNAAVEGIHQGWASAQMIATPVLLVPALRAGATSLDDRIWMNGAMHAFERLQNRNDQFSSVLGLADLKHRLTESRAGVQRSQVFLP